MLCQCKELLVLTGKPKKGNNSILTHNNSVNRSILYGLREALFFK